MKLKKICFDVHESFVSTSSSYVQLFIVIVIVVIFNFLALSTTENLESDAFLWKREVRYVSYIISQTMKNRYNDSTVKYTKEVRFLKKCVPSELLTVMGRS